MNTKERNYYFGDEIECILEASRGWQAVVVVDKKDKSERELKGVICKGIKGGWLVNEGDIDKPDFKQISLGKVKRIKINGLTIKPK